MFYVIATALIIIAVFFIYNAVTAFNELRKNVVKKVPAKPYMVWLFFLIALIFIALAVGALLFQGTWDIIWEEFWANSQPMLSEETKAEIYSVTSRGQSLAMYGAIILGGLFSISLIVIRRLAAHLFVMAMFLTLMTFLCFIANQYTEPGDVPKIHEQQAADLKLRNEEQGVSGSAKTSAAVNEEAVAEYFKDRSTDVITLSKFIKEYYRIPRDINSANVDQLRQYTRGLTEIKQNLVKVEVPSGAESAAKLTRDWLNQEMRLVTDCLAAKRESGIFGVIISVNNAVMEFIFSREREHAKTGVELSKLRRRFASDVGSDENLGEHFSFIK